MVGERWAKGCDVFGKQRPGDIGRDVPNNLRRHMDDEFVGHCSKAMFVTDLIASAPDLAEIPIPSGRVVGGGADFGDTRRHRHF